MRRLYLQVYLTIVASLVLVVLTAALLWHFFAGVGPFGPPFDVAGEIIAELVPPAKRRSARWGGRSAGVRRPFARTKEPLAAAGRPLPAPSHNGRPGGWMRTAA